MTQVLEPQATGAATTSDTVNHWINGRRVAGTSGRTGLTKRQSSAEATDRKSTPRLRSRFRFTSVPAVAMILAPQILAS